MVKKRKDKLLIDSPRVLDLTDDKGFLCGKILGDLGADVIKIEKIGGDPARRIGPFYKNIPDPQNSLYWFAFNTSKRGITLDIETADGREIFRKLAKKADIIVESFPPGHMNKLGLGYSTLREINSGIIMASITPFGQTGPYRDLKASDIVLIAMSGWMYLCGDPDHPPVRVSSPQAYLNAGAEAAVACLIALYHRERTGIGQHIDVSIQQSLIWTGFNAPAYWQLNRKILQREGPFRVGISSDVKLRQTWSCRDGFVSFTLFGGQTGAKTNRRLTEWMTKEGMAAQFLSEIDWENWDMAKVDQQSINRIEETISSFFQLHSVKELYDGAVERRIMLYPVSTPKEIVESHQLDARGFWASLEHPELGTAITYPGAFIKSSEVNCGPKHRAPLVGEHNLEIYEGELELPREKLVMLKQAGVI
jgi:crotonobetainyl-CoA:carnitine CoA-transferase CaiB-like acyl-CoA transferase